MPNLRTTAQNSRLFAIAGKLGITHDDLHDYAFEYSAERTTHTSELYVDECERLLKHLDKLANPNTGKWSPRTVSKAKKDAGIDTIVPAGQLNKLTHLWFEVEGRTAVGLRAMCQRVIKLDKPRTTTECNKVIEAVKSINRRATKAVA
jgi:hypothetical protein